MSKNFDSFPLDRFETDNGLICCDEKVSGIVVVDDWDIDASFDD